MTQQKLFETLDAEPDPALQELAELCARVRESVQRFGHIDAEFCRLEDPPKDPPEPRKQKKGRS